MTAASPAPPTRHLHHSAVCAGLRRLNATAATRHRRIEYDARA